METHALPSFSESTPHGNSCPGPPDHCAPSPEVRDGFQQASFLPSHPSSYVLGGGAQGDVWRSQAADGQRQHVPRRQETALGAGFRAQHWQPCTLLEAGGARCQGWLPPTALGKGWTGALRDEESLPTSGASLGVPSTWASLIPARAHP